MKKDFKYILKRILIGVGIILVMSFINSCQVHALTITNSGDSLKNIAKIGSQYVGANYFYEKAPNGWDESPLHLTFWVPAESISTIQGKRDVNFSVDWCVNGSQSPIEIWSKYSNSVDYTYALNKRIYVSNGDWALTNCYRSYITLNLNYILDTNNPIQDALIYSDNSNTFAIYSNDNFNKLIRYIDLVYYNSKDYDSALQNAQQIGQQTTIINQNTSINNSINGVNDSINDSSIPSDSSDKINNITSAITSNQNSAIVQLATFIPQTLQVILNGFNTSCTGGYSLGSLYGTELTIPCINPVDYLGSFLWGVIDSILCLCYLIPLCKFLVNKYNDLTSMKNLRWQ